jgi:hypothetical protein
MKKPSWWIFYKILIVFMSVSGMCLMIGNLFVGLFFLIFSILLWGTQYRREQKWDQERRHQETLDVMRMQAGHNPQGKPHQ